MANRISFEACGAGDHSDMAVSRRASGLGAVVLDWAADAARQRGTAALRLDCVRSNRRLRDYYEARGFTHRGDVPVGGAPGERVDDGGPVTWVSRYELRLAVEVTSGAGSPPP